MARKFKDLSEREVLALAISLEEEHERIYADFADGLGEYPASAEMFERIRAEESDHRGRLIELFRSRFGNHIPLIRRHDVNGFVSHKPIWLVRPLGVATVRKQVQVMEAEARRFYESAAQQVTDASTRKLLGDLAIEERNHGTTAERLEHDLITPDVQREEEQAQRRLFVLQIVQPGLAGLMDGSVS